MNSRYWNELSHDEQSKIENEWYGSNWYKNAEEESKTFGLNIIRYPMIIIIILALVMTFLFVAFGFELDVYGDVIFNIFFIIIFITSIITIIIHKSSKDKYLEGEMKKWLLKNYNIIK